jgi:hypothetical protein
MGSVKPSQAHSPTKKAGRPAIFRARCWLLEGCLEDPAAPRRFAKFPASLSVPWPPPVSHLDASAPAPHGPVRTSGEMADRRSCCGMRFFPQSGALPYRGFPEATARPGVSASLMWLEQRSGPAEAAASRRIPQVMVINARTHGHKDLPQGQRQASATYIPLEWGHAARNQES